MKARTSVAKFGSHGRQLPAVPSSAVVLFAIVIGLVCCTPIPSFGQPPIQDQGGSVVLSTNTPIPLSTLVDFVARRLQMQVLYDDTLQSKQVRLITPEPIPVARLYEVLQSILLAEGMVISEPDSAGLRRITATANLAGIATPSSLLADLQSLGPAVPITKLITLKNVAGSKIVEQLKPFLSGNSASAIAIENRNLIIVTDVAENVRKVAALIELLDQGGPADGVKFVRAENVRAEELATQLRELLEARQRALGKAEGDAAGIEVAVDERTNQVILIGNEFEIQRAESLLKTIDVALPTIQDTFTLEFISPERLDQVLREILAGRSVAPPYRARAEGSVLIIDSTREVLDLARRISRSLDTREAPLSQSPLRFYKIKNVAAEELAATIRSLSGQIGPQQRGSFPPRRLTGNDAALTGPNIPALMNPGSAQPVQVPPLPPAVRNLDARGVEVLDSQQGLSQSGMRFPLVGSSSFTDDAVVENRGSDSKELLGAAQITVDAHSNTIIILAESEVQRVYASLIEQLDKRPPQVLVEAKIVIIDTSDDYSLGVEVSGGDRLGAKRLFAFSSYGLSEVDPVNGALQVIPGVGFNGTLVDPTTADVVVRAIAQHRRARVLSTPRVLVNDNAEGQLTSVLEVPFTSINASQTVATTSFAGFAEAGTTINVRPTISEDNYLQLEYVVTLNSFSGPGTTGVPPPRQTNEVRSRVTVPDGFTVIVGGLVSKNGSYEIDSIPWLERIPILRELASLQTWSDNETSLFVFLKPVILREDKFRDLKFFSGVDQHKSKIGADYPSTRPLTIE